MRPNALVVLAMFVFMSPGLVTYAVAQRHGMGGGAPQGPHISAPRVSAPAPHISPPAPHISPPAPHVSAPRFAVPHAATPAPRIAAPRMARPHVGTQRFSAPHVAAPHASSRRFTAPHIAVPRRAPPNTAVGRFSPRSPGGLARHNVGPRVSNSARTIGRVHTHALAPSTARQVRGNPRTEPGWGAGDIARGPHPGVIPGASETVGQAPAAANHNPAQSGRGQMQGAKWVTSPSSTCSLVYRHAMPKPGVFYDVDVPRTVCAAWLRARTGPAPSAARHRTRLRRSTVLAVRVRRFHRLQRSCLTPTTRSGPTLTTISLRASTALILLSTTQMPMRTRACRHRARLMLMRRDHRGVGELRL